MADIKAHVTSLKISKRLKALGLKQDSLFYWWEDARDDETCQGTYYYIVDIKPENLNSYSAYLASELGEIIFEQIKDIEIEYLHEVDGIWYRLTSPSLEPIWDEKTLSDAMVKLLIYLIENGLVDDEWRERWLTGCAD